MKPYIGLQPDGKVLIDHTTLGKFRFAAEGKDKQPRWLFTENETNLSRVFGAANRTPYVKDAFHRFIINQEAGAVNPANVGSKAGAYYQFKVPPGGQVSVRLRLYSEQSSPQNPFDGDFDQVFKQRIDEADAFYDSVVSRRLPADSRNVARQGFAGLLWSKQFYHYIVKDWLTGDPDQPTPPESRWHGRNHDWLHLFNRDIISMPDKWEYPWYASWDLAFHMITLATVDAELAKEQLILLMREWYMHGSGQIPAYEFEFSDANPPVARLGLLARL